MEAKLQDMNSILRKVVPRGVTATANSCREQISFISLVSVLWRACFLLGFCSGCSTTTGQLHGSSGWSSYLAALEELSSSFILSFGGLHLFSPLFQPALSRSRALKIKTKNDRHPSLSFWDRGFGLCRRHCFFFFFLFVAREAVEQIVSVSSCPLLLFFLFLSCLCCVIHV